ncbi:MAG: J domain-containing protein [Rickettsiales bacterium]
MSDKKPRPRKRQYFVPHIESGKAPPCAIRGCSQAGEYKAPKSRDKINEYDWFCLEHIRERNKMWNFFSGMNEDEIEDFIKDSVTGHRPTWNRETLTNDKEKLLKDKLYEFLYNKKPSTPQPKIPTKKRKALDIMELNHPYTLKQLKASYKTLVKKYHPDKNSGDKLSEEKFKKITVAYQYLLKEIK